MTERKSSWQKARMTLGMCGLAIVLGLAVRMCTGCSSTGPTKLERALFTTETNYVPKVVLVTNVVEHKVDVPQPVIIYQTNVEHQVTVTYQTNLVQQVAYETNVTRLTITNAVETLGAPSGVAKTAAGAAGTVATIAAPGVGGLVTAAVLGALAIWAGIRNRQLKGHNDALSQTAGTLAQVIETGREIMAKTEQGGALADQFTAWMKAHQAETGVIQTVAGIVKSEVDNGEAKDAADQILALMDGTGKK